MEPFEKPSTWVLALATGLLVPGIAALGDLGHALRPAAFYALLGVVSFASVLGFVYGLPTLLWLVTLAIGVTRLIWPPAPPMPLDDSQTPLDAPPAPEPAQETIPDHSGAWRHAVETFLLAGEVRGFSARKMAGIVGSDGWPIMKSWLIEQGILADMPGKGTTWAEGVTLAIALTRLRSGALPFPDGLPPHVEMPVNNAATRNATRQGATPATPAD